MKDTCYVMKDTRYVRAAICAESWRIISAIKGFGPQLPVPFLPSNSTEAHVNAGYKEPKQSTTFKKAQSCLLPLEVIMVITQLITLCLLSQVVTASLPACPGANNGQPPATRFEPCEVLLPGGALVVQKLIRTGPCLFVVAPQQSHAEAEETCKALGLHLAVVDSVAKKNKLLGIDINGDGTTLRGFWTDGKTALPDTERLETDADIEATATGNECRGFVFSQGLVSASCSIGAGAICEGEM